MQTHIFITDYCVEIAFFMEMQKYLLEKKYIIYDLVYSLQNYSALFFIQTYKNIYQVACFKYNMECKLFWN